MATGVQQKWLDAPKSSNTVRVRMINTTSDMLLSSKPFIQPIPPDHKKMNMTDMAFLIENERLDKKAVFDLGVRKDFWNFPPTIRKGIGRLAIGLRVEKDVPEILEEKGVSVESINDIIWSHSHFDHTGDPSLFPPTTTLNYGPEVSSFLPGYPTDPSSPHPETNFTGRPNNEINFTSSPTGEQLRIGGFPAHDFYNDGSFYLLETPGHSKGHMCGLARTTPSDSSNNDRSTWVLLGGDVCHFCGDMRPNATHPLPAGDIDVPGLAAAEESFKLTGAELLKRHPQFSSPDTSASNRATTPWYNIPTEKYTGYDYPSPEVAQETIRTLTSQFDVMENVFVMLAHDVSLATAGVVPVFNDDPDRDLNAWYEQGWKTKLYWGWIKELLRKENIVEGLWRDGVRYEGMDQLVQAEKEEGEAKGKL